MFGKQEELTLFYKGVKIEQVKKYKYVGNIIYAISKPSQNVFKENYTYLADQARKAIFGMKQKLRSLGTLPPDIMFHIFDSLIKPILTYGSDVWGIDKKAQANADKVFLNYARSVLKVNPSTSNVMVYGECGRPHPA